MKQPRVLVVEDERIIALNLRQKLTVLGYDAPIAVATGEEALRQIEEARPDVVLMDVNLEGAMDGIETTARIPPEYHLPVIYLTAYSEDSTLERAGATHPGGYLLKPFSDRELHATLQMALARSRVEAETRVAEARQRQWQRMEALARVAGGVAQNLDSLLATMFAGLEELGDHATDSSEAAKRLRVVTDAAVREERMVQRLLTFSQQRALAPSEVAVNRFVWNMIDGLYQTVGDDIRIHPHLSRGLWRVRVDEDEFETALLNLADNAREAMPGGGSLTIHGENVVLGVEQGETRSAAASSTTPPPPAPFPPAAPSSAQASPGRYVRLTVSDTGVGMTEAVARNAFEPFFTTKTLGRGAGLGLSHVFGFARQAGGSVEIESRAGEGTSIRLHLPAAKGDAPA